MATFKRLNIAIPFIWSFISPTWAATQKIYSINKNNKMTILILIILIPVTSNKTNKHIDKFTYKHAYKKRDLRTTIIDELLNHVSRLRNNVIASIWQFTQEWQPFAIHRIVNWTYTSVYLYLTGSCFIDTKYFPENVMPFSFQSRIIRFSIPVYIWTIQQQGFTISVDQSKHNNVIKFSFSLTQ